MINLNGMFSDPPSETELPLEPIATDETSSLVEPTTFKRVVCPMLTKSELEANNVKFEVERFDWNLCTHVISGDERGDGGMKLQTERTVR